MHATGQQLRAPLAFVRRPGHQGGERQPGRHAPAGGAPRTWRARWVGPSRQCGLRRGHRWGQRSCYYRGGGLMHCMHSWLCRQCCDLDGAAFSCCFWCTPSPAALTSPCPHRASATDGGGDAAAGQSCIVMPKQGWADTLPLPRSVVADGGDDAAAGLQPRAQLPCGRCAVRRMHASAVDRVSC